MAPHWALLLAQHLAVLIPQLKVVILRRVCVALQHRLQDIHPNINQEVDWQNTERERERFFTLFLSLSSASKTLICGFISPGSRILRTKNSWLWHLSHTKQKLPKFPSLEIVNKFAFKRERDYFMVVVLIKCALMGDATLSVGWECLKLKEKRGKERECRRAAPQMDNGQSLHGKSPSKKQAVWGYLISAIAC